MIILLALGHGNPSHAYIYKDWFAPLLLFHQVTSRWNSNCSRPAFIYNDLLHKLPSSAFSQSIIAMHLLSSLFYLSVASTSLALVSAPLGERALGDSCSAPEGSGTCQKTSDCTSQGFNVAGHCPGASDIQCCIKKTCATPSGSGICQDKGDNACSGSYVSGYCPGASSIEVHPAQLIGALEVVLIGYLVLCQWRR